MTQEQNASNVVPANTLTTLVHDIHSLHESLAAFEQWCAGNSSDPTAAPTGYDDEARVVTTALKLLLTSLADLTDSPEILGVTTEEHRIVTGFSVIEQGSDPKYPDGFFSLAEMLVQVIDAESYAITEPSKTSIPMTIWCEVDPCSDPTHPDYSVDMCGE